MLILLHSFLLVHEKLLLVLIICIFIVLNFNRVVQSVVAIVEIIIGWGSVNNHVLQRRMIILNFISLLVSLQTSSFILHLALKLIVMLVVLSCCSWNVPFSRCIHMLIQLPTSEVHLLSHKLFHLVYVVRLIKVNFNLVNINFILLSVPLH